MTPNFFPRLSNSTSPKAKRIPMTLSNEQLQSVSRGYWVMYLTDLVTGHTLKVKGAECSIEGCMCDAQIAKSSLNQINKKYEIVK